MNVSRAPVSDGLAWFPAHRFFHELSPRARVVLSQLPLTVTMVLVTGIVLVFHPALLRDPVFEAGLMLHALMFILARPPRGIGSRPQQRLPCRSWTLFRPA